MVPAISGDHEVADVELENVEECGLQQLQRWWWKWIASKFKSAETISALLTTPIIRIYLPY